MKKDKKHKPFTEDDLDNCWQYYKSYLVDILNGEYDLNEARADLRWIIGSRFDKRKVKADRPSTPTLPEDSI